MGYAYGDVGYVYGSMGYTYGSMCYAYDSMGCTYGSMELVLRKYPVCAGGMSPVKQLEVLLRCNKNTFCSGND